MKPETINNTYKLAMKASVFLLFYLCLYIYVSLVVTPNWLNESVSIMPIIGLTMLLLDGIWILIYEYGDKR